MVYFVGLDVSLKATRICVVDEDGRPVREGIVDTQPEMIADRLARFSGELVLVGLETASITPWLYRSLMVKANGEFASCRFNAPSPGGDTVASTDKGGIT